MILDTTFLIDLIDGDEAAVRRAQRLEQEGEALLVPTPAIAELWEGLERSNRPSEEVAKIEAILREYRIIAFEAPHARRAGVVSGQLIRRRQTIDTVDTQIAGIAIEEFRPVLTRNVEHFRRVPDLKVETY